MKDLFLRYATPLITGLFLVSLVSGVALFLGWRPAAFHQMHEILSLVLIAPFALHLWRNWRPFTRYMVRAPMAIALALSLAAAIPFAWPAITGTQGEGAGGPPPFSLARSLAAQPLDVVAPALGLSPETLATRLQAAGIPAKVGAAAPLAEIAQAAGKAGMPLYAAMAGR